MTTINKQKGFVIMMDVMGTRGFTDQQNMIYLGMVRLAKTLVRKQLNTINSFKKESPETIFHNVGISFIGDTIIINFHIEGIENKKSQEFMRIFAKINVICSSIYTELLRIGILTRGAVSYGEFIFEEKLNIILGPAVVEVAEWHEQIDTSGVFLTPKLSFMAMQYLTNNHNFEISEDYRLSFDALWLKNENNIICVKSNASEKSNYIQNIRILNFQYLESINIKYENEIRKDDVHLHVKKLHKHYFDIIQKINHPIMHSNKYANFIHLLTHIENHNIKILSHFILSE